MAKKTALLFVVLFATLNVNAQIPNFEWVKQIGAEGNENGKSVVLDSSNNIYLTGSFNDTIDFDPGPGVFSLTTGGVTELFVVKLDPAGNFIWAVKTESYFSNVNELDMAYSPTGNIVLTGELYGTVDFDPSPVTNNLTSVGADDIFIWNLDLDGNLVWAKNVGSLDEDGGTGIDADDAGNIYVTGYFRDTADFDPGPGTANVIATPFQDIFILKLDANGDYVFARNIATLGGGGLCRAEGSGIKVDANGNIYSTGIFCDSADFDTGAGVFKLFVDADPVFESDGDIYLLKLDPSGNFVWAQNYGGDREDFGEDVTVDQSGNVYVTGQFKDTADFLYGPGTYNFSTYFEDAFIFKTDPSGNFVWAKQVASSEFYDEGNAIAVDDLFNVYFTGSFGGTADLDPGIDSFIVNSNGDRDIFLIKLDANGDFVWGGYAGGPSSNDAGLDLVVDNAGAIFTTGGFRSTADFDFNAGVHNLTTPTNFDDLFLLKMSDGPAGLSGFENENGFSIVPNPASESFTILSSGLQWETELKIMDVLGREVYRSMLFDTATKINATEFSSGMYFVQMITPSKTRVAAATQKLIIQH